jgi:predicted O-methyltransferase YrrM
VADAEPDTLWRQVDELLNGLLCPPDEGLAGAVREAEAAGLPPHHVAPNQGKLLALLVRISGARRVLEIGTLGGYSTIWMARALPDGGELVTLEADPRAVEVARRNLAAAGVADLVDVRGGPALESLPRLAEEGASPFDLVFIDADKPNGPAYLSWALRLSHEGTVIVADNVVRGGAVVDDDSADERVRGVRRLLQVLADEPRLSATAIQTVGEKGHDGFLLALVV